MKSAASLRTCLLALTLATAVASGQAYHFTLESALESARDANLDILLGQEQVEQAIQNQRRARGALLPQISGEAAQSRSQGFVDLGSLGLGGGDDVGDDLPSQGTTTSNRFQALLRARLSIFDVSDHANYRVSRFNTEIARLELDSVVQDVFAGIAQAYLDHARDLRQEDAIRAQIERDQVLLDLATRRAEAGTATSLDVTRAEVRLSANQFRLAQQETAIYESELRFKRILNIDLGSSVTLEPLPFDLKTIYRFSRTDLEDIFARRPEVVQQRRALARNELARRAARFERLPSVELGGTYGLEGREYDADLEEVWSVQLGVNVPIFDGLRIEANRAEAASAVRAQEVVLEQVEQLVETDYRLALTRVDTAARSVEIARKQVELANRELDLAQRRFEEGVANNSEVVDAQASLAEAEDGLVLAEYQYHSARLQLARSRGDVLSLVRE